MSNEDTGGGVGGVGGMGGVGGEDMAGVGSEASAARVLGELAGSVEIGAVPYDRLVAGGRRRLRRRRLLTSAAVAALVAAAVVGGTALGGLGRGRGPGDAADAGVVVADARTVTTAEAAAGTAGTAGTAATPTAPERDPFTPVRVVVGQGTTNGRQWQAWAAFWPAAATKEDALRQARLIWADRHAAIPQLPETTRADIDRSWRPDVDLVNLYATVDGQRQVDDAMHDTPAPGAPDGAIIDRATSGGGTMLGLKGGELGASPVVIAGVRPQVAKVVVTWDTGGVSASVPVALGDSPTHWYAIAKKPGAQARTFTYYAADGSVLGTDASWFRSY
ncbi:hypothetical protein [Kitasatospora sp. NBC_01300]|uniref:hypothetical protein n=1 Tax=Kitasatospora sp. NBC_01300 TaxID=2903574 RepID=UPI00352D3FE9|nr:hypothetical protein OG556_16670 [Kitasatospora sp. NBC_01300]